MHKAIENESDNKTTVTDLYKKTQKSGLFVIISALPFRRVAKVPAYYVRLLAEQYFDIGKGISRGIPLRVHSEESVTGRLLPSRIAAPINVYIQ